MKILLITNDKFREICQAQNLFNPVRYASQWSIREGKAADRGVTKGIVTCTGGNVATDTDVFTFHQTPKSYGVYFEENRDTFLRQASRLQERSSLVPLHGLLIGGLSRSGDGASYSPSAVVDNYQTILHFLLQSGIGLSPISRLWGIKQGLPLLEQASIACIPDEDVQIVNISKKSVKDEEAHAILSEEELKSTFEEYYVAPGDEIITPKDKEYDAIVEHLLDVDARDAKDSADNHLMIPRTTLESSPTWRTFKQHMETGNIELQKQMARQIPHLHADEQLQAVQVLLATENQEIMAKLAMSLCFLSQQNHIQLKTFQLLLVNGGQEVLGELSMQIRKLSEAGEVKLKLFKEVVEKGGQNVLETLAFEFSFLPKDIQYDAFVCLIKNAGMDLLEQSVMCLGLLPNNKQLPAFKALLAVVLERGSPVLLDDLVYQLDGLVEEIRWDAFQVIWQNADESVRRKLKAQIKSLLPPEQQAFARQALA